MKKNKLIARNWTWNSGWFHWLSLTFWILTVTGCCCSGLREVIVALVRGGVRAHVEHRAGSGLPSTGDMELQKRGQWRAIKVIKGLELSHGTKGWESWDWPRKEKAWESGGRILSTYTKRGCKEHRARLFYVALSEITRGSRHKLKHRIFLLTIRKHFFAVRMP